MNVEGGGIMAQHYAGGSASNGGEQCSLHKPLDDACAADEAQRDPGIQMKAPGAAASTVTTQQLWMPLPRWLLQSRSSRNLRFFCHSCFSKQACKKISCDPRPVWPIPFPCRLTASSMDDADEKSFQQALNMMIVVLNWLHLGQPRRLPRDTSMHHPMTPEQLGIVKRLRRLAMEWAHIGPVSASEMGRSAAKVETMETMLSDLTAAAVDRGAKSRPVTSEESSLLADVQVAKDIECHRLTFRGTPSFNPSSLLEPMTRELYEDPVKFAIAPEDSMTSPPHVQVRGGRAEALSLLKKLDSSGRLRLCDPTMVRPGREAGLFSLMKNITTDRLILDSRPANELEPGLTEWTATMGHLLVTAGEDLRDYYYFFEITEARAERNAIRFQISPQEARSFPSFAKVDQTLPYYAPALATLAMGDLNAVEIGQQSHVKIAMEVGVELSDLVMLRARLPRSNPIIGVVIDDFIAIELVPKPLLDPAELQSSRIASKMVAAYASVGLQSNEKKRFRGELKAQFWGASLDGDAGALEKSLPLAMVTSQVAKLGVANRKLLEVLAGSWVATLQCRRRGMCLLSSIFKDIQRYDYNVNFPLLPETVDELWTLVCLCPLFVTDLRASAGQELSLVDASGEWEAEVSTTVPPKVAAELSRQKLTKAAWSRLLSPWKELQRIHGGLEPQDEVPEGEEAARQHPLWTSVIKTSRFSLRWRRRTKHRCHINVSELSAALRAESRRCRQSPNQRILLASDSQVTLGAMIRGRSSSPALNSLLKMALPTLLNLQYIHTLDNVADDPTRDRPCREPQEAEPPWLAELCAGNFQPLDAMLHEVGLGDSQVANFPEMQNKVVEEPEEPPFAPVAPSGQERPGPCRDLCSNGALCRKDPLCFSECPDACRGRDATGALRHGGCQPVGGALCRKDPLCFSECPDECRGRAATRALGHGGCQPVGGALPGVHSLSSVLRASTVQSFRTGRNKGRVKPPVAAKPVFEPWMPRAQLSPVAMDLLSAVPRSQFVLPRGLTWDAVKNKPGHLDLFSGCRIAAKELANTTGRWVLTYDLLHDPSEDLLDSKQQRHIESMLDADCFMTVSAGPVCASFSRAVRPAVRSADAPRGLPNLTPSMSIKVALGNAMSQWVASVVLRAEKKSIPFWVENPSGSYMWKQPEWIPIVARFPGFLTDYCRWGTAWRKRTRFAGSFSANGKRLLCQCGKPHVKLVGYNKEHKMSWTKLAEGYPVQPTRHRPPLPKVLLDAFVGLALTWGWARWAATTMLAFHGACRVGEPLKALRQDLILPDEAGLEIDVCFLNITSPKTSRRGRGRTQHTKITDESTVRLAKVVFSQLDPQEPLYPSSLSSYRRRWDRLLAVLEVPRAAAITPGCTRGGGAVYRYHVGQPISNIQWTMRIKHQQTLEHYLQETAALGVIQKLPARSRELVQSCAKMAPHILRLWHS